MATFWQDIRYGVRTLRKTPGFTVLALITLAIGIGANAAVFSLINGVLFRPLPGQRDGKLVRLCCGSRQPDGGFGMFSYPYYQEMARHSTPFEYLSTFAWAPVYLKEGQITRRTGAGLVSAEFFDTFGVTMAQGRSFTVEEARPGSGIGVAVISHRLWRRMGQSPNPLGQTILVNDCPVTVIGVLPKTFVSASNITNYEVWLPVGIMDRVFKTSPQDGLSRLHEHGYRKFFLIGRLKPGQTLTSVQFQLETSATYLASAYPAEYRDCTLTAGPMAHLFLRPGPGDDLPLGPPIVTLLAVSGAVLLIACLNLASMALARGFSRRGEVAIRFALGSSRRRIVRQLLTEGALLSLAGGVVALPIAHWSAGILVASFERFTGGEGTIPTDLDWRVLAATIGLCLLSTVLAGLGPACHLARTGAVSDLKAAVWSVPHRSRAVRQPLVVVQTALAFALVMMAGLFVRSVRNAVNADPGFGMSNGLLVEVDLNLLDYKMEQGRSMYNAILERVRSMPGVEAASLGYTVPFGDPYMEGTYRRAEVSSSATQGSALPAYPASISARCNIIGTDYFKALGVPLMRGREFSLVEEQSADQPPVVIVDDLLAQRLWPGQDPIGRTLQQGDNPSQIMAVVGVVPRLRDSIMEPFEHSHVYIPFGRQYQTAIPHISSGSGSSAVGRIKDI